MEVSDGECKGKVERLMCWCMPLYWIDGMRALLPHIFESGISLITGN